MKKKLFSILFFVVSIFLFAAIMGSVAAQTQFSCRLNNHTRSVTNGLHVSLQAAGNAKEVYRTYLVGLPVNNTHQPIVRIGTNGSADCLDSAHQAFDINLPGLPNTIEISAINTVTASTKIHFNQRVGLSFGYQEQLSNSEFLLVLDHLPIHRDEHGNLATIGVDVSRHVDSIELYVLPSNHDYVPTIHLTHSDTSQGFNYQSRSSHCGRATCEMVCTVQNRNCSDIRISNLGSMYFNDPHNEHLFSHPHRHALSFSSVMAASGIQGNGHLAFHITAPRNSNDHYTVLVHIRLR